MKVTGHKTEAVYRRDAIVAESRREGTVEGKVTMIERFLLAKQKLVSGSQ
jgi:hypothetical protein